MIADWGVRVRRAGGLVTIGLLVGALIPWGSAGASQHPATASTRAEARSGQHIAAAPAVQPARTGPIVGRMSVRGPMVAQSAEVSPLTARVARVVPQVAVVGRPVTITVVVANTGARTVLRPSVTVRLARRPLSTRADLTRWLDQATGVDVALQAASQLLPGNLPPGTTARIQVPVPASQVRSSAPYGAIPMAIDVSGRQASGELTASTRASILPFFRTKEFQPLSLAFAVPLTVDPVAGLMGPPGPDREKAWEAALGPTSRLGRVFRATSDFPVTWAIDPALLPEPMVRALVDPDPTAQPGPGSTAPTGSPGPTGSAPSSGRASAQTTQASLPSVSPVVRQLAAGPVETQLKADVAGRVTTEAGVHPLWQLPTQDPDLSAVLSSPHGDGLLGRLLTESASLPDLLGVPTTRVSWPVGDPLDEERRSRLVAGYGPTPPTLHIAGSSAVDTDPGNVGDAARRSGSGYPLLAYDESLSDLFGALGSPPIGSPTESDETAAEKVQRFVADTALLLGQRPGVDRSVLITAPRSFDPDPAAVAGLFDAVSRAPWVRITASSTLVQRLGSAEAASAGFSRVTSPPRTTLRSPVAQSPVDEQALRRVAGQLDELAGLKSIEVSGAGGLWAATEAALATVSTRWRANPGAYASFGDAVERRVGGLGQGIRVVPSTVNFFADSGVLQITVTNTLDSDVAGVRLMVDPEGRQSRLRVLRQPDPLEIRRNSRITVRLDVEAAAPGVAALPTRLMTPAGTRLGDDATVRVEVRPANGWMVLVVGGAAAIIFLVGLYRALRLGSPRVPPVQRDQIELG